MGDIVEAAASKSIKTRVGMSGHALFGPYEQRAPGRYVVEFLISPDGDSDRSAEDEICALIDVVGDYGQTEVAFDYVLGSEISTNRPIRLEFDLAQAATLEYRLWVNGRIALRIADDPRVTHRPGDGPARSRLPESLPPPLDRRIIKRLYERGVPLNVDDETVSLRAAHLAPFMEVVAGYGADRAAQARRIAELVGWRGDSENSLYRAFVGQTAPTVVPPQPVPFTSTACRQAHFALDQYRYWAGASKEQPHYTRKQWEFVYIAQALYERGLLAPGRAGLVFGAGQEQLPSLFASFGVRVVASDQAPEAAAESGWAATGQHTFDLSVLNSRSICTDRMFSELVSYRSVDMNDIPADLDGQFDFCWSACALEHLGSLERGLKFIENSLHTLRPGGVAVHTTELNLTSNEHTLESQFLSIYRRQDIERFVSRLEAQSFDVSPIDWALGEGFAETVIDLPPFGRGEPHIRLLSGQYEVTSIGLIVSRPQA